MAKLSAGAVERVKRILETEKDDILEWIEESEEAGHCDLTEFKWKGYRVNFHSHASYFVQKEHTENRIQFESWQECLDYVGKEFVKEYTK